MTYDLSQPKIWVNRYSDDDTKKSDECQCDGACPTPLETDKIQVQHLVNQVVAGNVQDVWINDDIYLGRVDDYVFALSATGEHVVVLDSQANQLLSTLNTTSSIDILKKTLPWPNDKVDLMVALLLAEGVLVSPQAKSSRINKSNSSTLSAWLHLTNGCNLSCKYCYLNLNGKHMDMQTVEKAVDSVYRSALINGFSSVKLKYAGGEPTLNFKSLMAAQQKAERLSKQTNILLETVMLTNGLRLTDDQINKLIRHNIRVMISLDGLGDAHDVQRPLAGSGKGSFEEVSKTINHLVSSGISPHISITITNRNIKGMPSLVEYVLKKGLRFSLNFYREPNDLPIYSDLSFSSSEMIDGLKLVYEVIERHLPRYNLLSNLSDRADLSQPHSYTCGVGKNYMVINYDGSIAKCQMDISAPVTSVDSKDPLMVIRADLHGLQNLSVETKELNKCVWRYRCTGGCPRLTFQRTGSYSAKSPMCEIYEAILPEIVRLEALRLIRYESPWEFQMPIH